MQIPHEVTARPDTGLYNAKLGIWLFLASEVMLFGGLFSAYIFMRLGTDPGYWPHGILNVPIGTLNTMILITSSITVVLAWAALKMRRWTQYWWYMLATLVCGISFLTIKLTLEWPPKFEHFGIYVKKESAAKPEYEAMLGNKAFEEAGSEDRRYEVTGHLHRMDITRAGKPEVVEVGEQDKETEKAGEGTGAAHESATESHVKTPSAAQAILAEEGVKLVSYTLHLDPVNAEPNAEENQHAHFWYRGATEKEGTIKAEDIASASAFFPRHNTYLATYFLITGLHGLHIVGGIIVFGYMFLFGKKLYLRNPEHMANRVECAGLYWHFVDLVWIFVFPVFYLL